MPSDKKKKYTNQEIGQGLGLLSLAIGAAGWILSSEPDKDKKKKS